MAKLQQFLDLLDRPGVREVILQSNSQPSVRLDDGLRPVARQFLSTDHVHAIVRGSSLERLLPKADEPRQTASFEHGGRLYAVKLARFGDRLQVRIARSAASSPRPAGAPATRPEVPISAADFGSLPPGPSAPRSSDAPPPTVAQSPIALKRPAPEYLPAVLGGDVSPDTEVEPDVPHTDAAPTPLDLAPPPPTLSGASYFSRPLRPQRRISAEIEAIPLQLATEPDLPPLVPAPPIVAEPPPRAVTEPPATTPSEDDELPAVLGFGLAPDPPITQPAFLADSDEDDAEPTRVLTRTDSIPAVFGGSPTLVSATTPVIVEAPAAFSVEAMEPPELMRMARVVEPVGAVPPLSTATRSQLVELVAQARGAGASDIHLFSGLPPRLRILGELRANGPAISHDDVKDMLLPWLTPTKLDELEARGHTHRALDLGAAGRVRATVSRQRSGLKGCLRLVPDSPGTFTELGLPPALNQVLEHKQGLVLVAGPPGHGKTTTLAALVHLFNVSRALHVVTIEDPIEHVHAVHAALVSQREVGTHTTSFAHALRAALREDPDVIAVGELADARTAEMVLTACQTGHLVLATLNATTAQRAIERLLDLYPIDQQPAVRTVLAGALKLVVAQRLLPRADARGLVPAVEVVTGGIPLWTLIRDDKLFQLPALQRRARHHGMVPFTDAVKLLLQQGTITPELAAELTQETGIPAPEPLSRLRPSGGLKDLLGRR